MKIPKMPGQKLNQPLPTGEKIPLGNYINQVQSMHGLPPDQAWNQAMAVQSGVLPVKGLK